MRLPFSNSGRFSKLHAQPFSAVTVLVATVTPLAFRWTVMDSGRTPSWLLPSTQVLEPLTEMTEGVCLLVTVRPLAVAV